MTTRVELCHGCGDCCKHDGHYENESFHVGDYLGLISNELDFLSSCDEWRIALFAFSHVRYHEVDIFGNFSEEIVI